MWTTSDPARGAAEIFDCHNDHGVNNSVGLVLLISPNTYEQPLEQGMKKSIAHGLSKEMAKKATSKAFETYQARFPEYEPQATWVRDDKAEVSFSAKGLKLEGGVEIREQEIDLELNVPFLLKPFSKKAMSIIEEEVREWVEKAKKGELGE